MGRDAKTVSLPRPDLGMLAGFGFAGSSSEVTSDFAMFLDSFLLNRLKFVREGSLCWVLSLFLLLGSEKHKSDFY